MDIGIDLGTASVLIFVKDQGIVLKEPSIVALDTQRDEVVAVGDEAYPMLGRTPPNIKVVRPLRDGVISDYRVTEIMLRCGFKNQSSFNRIFRQLTGVSPYEYRQSKTI